MLIDNLYVAGSNHPITRTDAEGNTYQQRQLENGTAYDVLKNFPSEAELRAAIRPYAMTVQYEQFTYYWLLSYTLP